eukprot:CAMPEP_0201535080 /NCGR_PEP_ID=MMETSP0161_2-20130828/57985_1 /ASSEMBLY_ACC=CAM_ASM_000251 /TAXON_ID=180227 /ORGANISM="Neoparamoeba aestuarina, Strain SoJaBio B1-5/56/2" /LENGTH=321 /DNA_ID=CAMNT_0047940045 /DNA_START=73 /DNA_END=1035 /DNA_ORIENTATION=-
MAKEKIRLSVIFEVEGLEDPLSDYLVFHSSTDVETALAIVRSHFTNKFHKGGYKEPLSPKFRKSEKLRESGGKKDKAEEKVSECIATWGYDAVEKDELSFKEGDKIKVLAKLHQNWWRGELNGKRGLFPAVYVQEIDELEEDDFDDPITAHDPEMYGLYAPPPIDKWLQNNEVLKTYDFKDFQCVKYQKLPVKERPARSARRRSSGEDTARNQRRDDIETALRLFAGSGNLTADIFVRDVNQKVSLEMSDGVFTKDVMAMLAKQLKGRKGMPGFQQEEVRLRDYGLVCLAPHQDFAMIIPPDQPIRSFLDKGKIELRRLWV